MRREIFSTHIEYTSNWSPDLNSRIITSFEGLASFAFGLVPRCRGSATGIESSEKAFGVDHTGYNNCSSWDAIFDPIAHGICCRDSQERHWAGGWRMLFRRLLPFYTWRMRKDSSHLKKAFVTLLAPLRFLSLLLDGPRIFQRHEGPK